MSIAINYDEQAPSASVEWRVMRPLPDFDLTEIEAPIPRDVDPMLASQGFKDLLDEVRGILDDELTGSSLEIVQLTGAICHDRDVYRPGVWLVVRERGAIGHISMTPESRARIEKGAEVVRDRLGLS